MNQREIKELIEFLVEKDIAEFELERGDLKIRVRRGSEGAARQGGEPTHVIVPAVLPGAVAAPASAASGAPPAAPQTSAVPAPASAEEAGLHMVKSPIVGTFFEAPSPGSPPFVKVGDAVELGTVLCIVEAMKLMNEIESDMAGEIAKKFVANGQPVEYGQALFAIRTK
jgi:acetyl-CoA carboxylase biotin carboxyl carrier protein